MAFEKRRIFETIARIPDNEIRVDVLVAINIFKIHGILQKDKCEMLTKVCSECKSNNERLKVFVCNIYERGSLKFLFHILDVIGLRHISDEIVRPVSRPMHRPELTHSKHLQTFYYQLKSSIDESALFDRGEFLRDKYTRICKSFNELRSDNDLLKKAGQLAVVTWLRIQHCKRNTQLIREVLNGMLEYWPRNCDDTLAIIFYNSKMAIAAIMDGDVTSAEEHSRIAKHLSAPFQDPLTKTLICHDSRYTNQRIFELQRLEKHRKAIFDEAIAGLCFIKSDSNGCELFNIQMERMFLLYVAQYNLNIHNDLNSSESDDLLSEDVRSATNAIDAFERTFKSGKTFDPRRGMIFYVCRAKVHESKEEIATAKGLLDKAMELANEGCITRMKCKI